MKRSKNTKSSKYPTLNIDTIQHTVERNSAKWDCA